MGDTTNQKKGIVTRGSGHIAESSGVTLPYFEKGTTGAIVKDDNHIATAKCSVAQAAQRTFIQGANVLHNESKIGFPLGGGFLLGARSTYDRPHGNAENKPLVFGWFAVADEKSQDTKVEGKWIVRTFDKTIQDAGNGSGKFSPGAGSTEILDESELLFQQCAVEKIKLESPHVNDDKTILIRSTMDGELHVFLGKKVTVTAYRVNASETDADKRLDVTCYISKLKEKKKPPAEETQHAAFVLTRNGRYREPPALKWDEIKNKTLVGKNSKIAGEGSKKQANISTLVLGEDWLLDDAKNKFSAGPVGGTYGSYDLRDEGRAIENDFRTDAKRDALDAKVTDAQGRVATAQRGPGRRENRATRRASAQVAEGVEARNQFDATQAERAQGKEAGQALQAKTRLVLDTFKMVDEVFTFKPLRIDLEAHGCSPGATARILGYPAEQYGAEFAALKDWANPFTQLKTCVSTVCNFFESINGAGVSEHGPFPRKTTSKWTIDLYFFRNKKTVGTGETETTEDLEPSIELALAWKELERDSNSALEEEAGRKSWQVRKSWEITVKLERLVGIVVKFEVNLAEANALVTFANALLGAIGVKASGVFIGINFNLSVGVGGKVGVDEYGKWVTSVFVDLKSVAQLSLVMRVGDFLEVAVRFTGIWAPAIALTKNDKGQLCVQCTKSELKMIFVVEAALDLFGWKIHGSYELWTETWTLAAKDIYVFGGAT